MAAATVDYKRTSVAGSDFQLQEMRLSSLTSGQLENVAHGGPNGVACLLVLPEVVTPTTSGDPVSVEHVVASDDTTNNTLALRFRVPPAGDITGAVVKIWAIFIGRASGGLNP